VRFSAPNSSDAIKNLLANKRRLFKFKYFLYVRIAGDKPESRPAKHSQEQLTPKIQNRREVQKMCAFQNRNESGTSINQIITQLSLEQRQYLIPEISSPTAQFPHQIPWSNTTAKFDRRIKTKEYTVTALNILPICQ